MGAILDKSWNQPLAGFSFPYFTGSLFPLGTKIMQALEAAGIQIYSTVCISLCIYRVCALATQEIKYWVFVSILMWYVFPKHCHKQHVGSFIPKDLVDLCSWIPDFKDPSVIGRKRRNATTWPECWALAKLVDSRNWKERLPILIIGYVCHCHCMSLYWTRRNHRMFVIGSDV